MAPKVLNGEKYSFPGAGSRRYNKKHREIDKKKLLLEEYWRVTCRQKHPKREVKIFLTRNEKNNSNEGEQQENNNKKQQETERLFEHISTI